MAAKTKSEKLYELRKWVKTLSKYVGSGTQLISVYIPADSPIHDMSGKLREELSQASNIKSKQTRTNVMGALERIINHLKLFKQTPPRGIAIFAGNISDNPAKTDIQLFSLEPPEVLKIGTYRCDSRFFLEPLQNMMETKDAYGIVVLDGRDATIAIVKGTEIRVVKKLHSMAHAKIRKGGQCLSQDTFIETEDGTIKTIKELKKNECIRSMELKNRKIENRACSDVFTTKPKAYYIIRTKWPKNEIEATPYHRFLVLSEYGIKEKYAKDLKKNDRLLAVRKIGYDGSRVPTNVKCRTKIILSKKELIRLKNRRIELGYSQKHAGKKIEITQMAVCRMEDGTIPLSDAKIRGLYKIYGLKLNEKKFARKEFHFPGYYTPELAYLMGAICGDGTIDGNRIIIYESKNEIIEKYCKLIKSVLKKEAVVRTVNKNGKKGSWAKNIYYEIRIYSLDFCDVVLKIAPEIIAKSSERDIPSDILRCKKEVIAGFLSGLFDAEGYLHDHRVDLSMISKKLVRKLQLLLLRFDIISSFGKKKVDGNPQWYLSISDIRSIKNFEKHIGFSRPDKAKRLKKICKRRIGNEYINQIPMDGREVYSLIKEAGMKTSDFHAASCFFRNLKPLGKESFVKNILAKVDKQSDAKKVSEYLRTIMESDVIPVQVVDKTLKKTKDLFYDITVPVNSNFMANGLIVHNSAARYQRLIEESIDKYYQRVSASMDNAYLGKVKGVIVGGPGPTKEFFLKAKHFNYQTKIMGVVDTGYTDEYGVREVLEKSDKILAEQEAVKEKILVDRFIKEAVSNGLATYGEKQVRETILSKQAEKVLLSEGLEYTAAEYKCPSCGNIERKIFKENPDERIKCKCGAGMRLESEKPLIDDLEELARENNIEVEIISTNTTEGMQFLTGFGGIGAILRYKTR